MEFSLVFSSTKQNLQCIGSLFTEVPGSSDEDGSSPSDSSDVPSPEALPLLGAGGGHSKRRYPLTHKGALERTRSPLRRGGGSLYGVDLHGKGKGKKGSISNIFQTSVTALSFLAFGGYLLCLIVQAIRAKNTGVTMMNGAALHANLSRFVFVGRRPTPGKRRKRDSRDEEMKAERLDRKTPEAERLDRKTPEAERLDRKTPEAERLDRKTPEAERLDRKTPEVAASSVRKNRSLSDISTAQYDYKHGDKPRVGDEMELVESQVETITDLDLDLGKKIGSDDKREFSEGLQKAVFNQTLVEHQSDEGTVETSDDQVSEDLDTAEKVRQANVYREDLVQLGLWPMANVDDMYSALLMIAEGYSQYHQKFHTG
jgi:hypothetical protein